MVSYCHHRVGLVLFISTLVFWAVNLPIKIFVAFVHYTWCIYCQNARWGISSILLLLYLVQKFPSRLSSCPQPLLFHLSCSVRWVKTQRHLVLSFWSLYVQFDVIFQISRYGHHTYSKETHHGWVGKEKEVAPFRNIEGT